MSKSIYIHIPFCKSICTYCAFCKRYYNEKEAVSYLDKLNGEFDERIDTSKIYQTIYIGGGTPSSLSKDDLDKLFSFIDKLNLTEDYEFTFEMNPEDISEKLLNYLKSKRVNRLSIGVQSFNDENLLLLGRRRASITKLLLAKSIIPNISLDLIYGIDFESLEDDLEEFINLDFPHIALYSLMIEENTILKINGFKSVSEEDDLKMYNYIKKRLSDAGYVHYEISNYAKPGFYSKHNYNYWNNGSYYGLGLGAMSYVDNYHILNTCSLKNYPKVIEKTYEDKTSQIEYFIMMGLRKIKGISKKEFKETFNKDIKDLYNVNLLIKELLLGENNEFIYIKEDKLYLENYIINKLLTSNLS